MSTRESISQLLKCGVARSTAAEHINRAAAGRSDAGTALSGGSVLQTSRPGPAREPRFPALVLAPMATITHAGFRTLVSEFGGCDLYFTEMISAEALLGGTPYESAYLALDPDPQNTIYQLVGNTHEALVAAAGRLAQRPCAGIDINMGCSAPHIVRKGGGISWMTRPVPAADLIATLRELLPNHSLSVKIRLGANDDPNALIRFATLIEESGADFITLHPKLRKEGSARAARWSYVRVLRSRLTIPVIGNGGILDGPSYDVRTSSPASAHPAPVMVGRGAVRAPWIFAHLRRREHGYSQMPIDLAEVLNRFIELLEIHQPADFWPSRARRVYPYIFRNLPFAHSFGARLAATRNYELGKSMVREYFAADPARRRYVERG